MKNEKYDPAITNYSKFNKLFPHATQFAYRFTVEEIPIFKKNI